jgi:hypothetical protein
VGGYDEEAQETSINVGHLRRQESQGTKQIATTISQPSAANDLPIMDETSVHLDQIHRSDVPQTIQYKAPANIEQSTGSILTTASTLGQEEPAQETPVNITQVRRADAPQSVQYKAPADIQLSAGSILTTASALSGEEPAQETPVNLTQLRQPTPKDLPPSDVTQQQASSVTQLSAATDLPILDETSIQVDQLHLPDTPQSIQYKAPADIQPSTGSILTTASALGQEEPAQETSVNVTQLRQAAAKELPAETKQQAIYISQPSLATDVPLLDESAVNIDQIHLAQAPQPFEYKAPSNIKQALATLLSSPSVLANEADQDETMLTTVQGYQQQQGHKIQRPSVVSDLSYAPAEDEFAELAYEIQVQQQRLLKMPPKLLEQPKLIQSRTSIVESDDQTQSTMVGQRRQMVAAIQKLDEKEEEEEEEKEKSISPEPSMNVDEVIETIRLEDELLELKEPFVADIPAPTEENLALSTPAAVEVLPSIEELPQTTSEEISMQLNQLETVSSDERVEEVLPPPPINAEIQPLINQLDQVSSTQPASLNLPTTEEVLSFAAVEKELPTPVPEKTEDSFEILSSKVVDYIEIPPPKTDSDEQRPERIIITEEIKPVESIPRIEGTSYCYILTK